jgi:hypothetical protein
MLCAEDSSAQGSGQDCCRQGVHAAASEALAHVDVLSMFMMSPTCVWMPACSTIVRCQNTQESELASGQGGTCSEGQGCHGQTSCHEQGGEDTGGDGEGQHSHSAHRCGGHRSRCLSGGNDKLAGEQKCGTCTNRGRIGGSRVMSRATHATVGKGSTRSSIAAEALPTVTELPTARQRISEHACMVVTLTWCFLNDDHRLSSLLKSIF